MKPASLLSTVCTLTCLILPGLVFYMVDLRIVYNQSQSLRGSIFIMQYKTHYQPKVDDIVLFQHSKYQELILKKVSHVGEQEYKPVVGYAIELQEDINQQTTVPKGHVAVQGDHPRSYDSRYASFGFIPLKNIRGKAWLIF